MVTLDDDAWHWQGRVPCHFPLLLQRRARPNSQLNFRVAARIGLLHLNVQEQWNLVDEG